MHMSVVNGEVLVADDDPAIREVVSEYLSQRGFEVVEAGNGLEALLQVKHGRPSAVVIDLTMPRLGGLDTLKRIRAFDPSIVMVVVSAHADEFRQQALSLGAVAALAKPIDLPDLLRALGRAEPTPRAATPPEASSGVAPRPRHGQVLVVDDDPAIRLMLEDFLTAEGYRTRSVADGTAAVRAIVEDPPEVVLLDLEMPGLNGIHALPTIRAVAPHTQVIMVSGVTDTEISRRALANGAFDYAVKPVDIAYLGQSVETAMAMSRFET